MTSGDPEHIDSGQRARAPLLRERDVLLERLRVIEATLRDQGSQTPDIRADADGEAAGDDVPLHASWQSILDALPAHIALLDQAGRILAVNEAWRRFGRANALSGTTFGVGDDYLGVCDLSQGICAEEGIAVSKGIREVLDGSSPQFAQEYPCHSPQEQRWFRMVATPLDASWHGRGCVVMHVDITDRRLAEESLRLNESRLRALLDAEPECVKVVSADGRLLSMNPAGLNMLEATDFAQIAGRPIKDLLHPDDLEAYREKHARVLSGANAQMQFRVIGLQGRERWMDTHSTPLHNPDGSVQGVLSVTRDITERRAADAQLASLQQLHERILDSVAEGIFGIDLEGRVTFANPAAEEILGWPEDEIVGREKHALVHHHRADGSDYPADTCPILLTLQDGAARRVDGDVFFHRDGQAIAVEYVVSPVRGANQTVQGAVVCYRDISRRLSDQAALVDREERFRLAARATVNAIWDWDLASGMVVWSGGLEALFGFKDDYLRLQIDFWSERIHPDDQERISTSLDQALAGERDTWGGEYRFRRPDGSYATVVDSGFVMRDAQGKAVRMVGGMTDVSRTRTLEAQLRASQRLEAVGQLTGGVAHDFNNLLTVVLGNAELLQERLPGGTAESQLASMIMAAAQRGSNLTQRLLAFARRQALDARAVRLGELVRGMEHLLRRAIGDHIELIIHAVRDDWVLIDAAQMENALLNLCLNARDAMPGSGRLSITVAVTNGAPPDIDPLSRSAPGPYVRLEVRDTGSGIAEDVLPRVIEPFFTTKDMGKGTGLGLSMVYGLVKQSNGYLDIRSEPGRGTCVRIHLPQVSAPAVADLDESAATADAAVPQGGDEHLLLVEDDALVRQYAATQLQALGYRVTAAKEGIEALQRLQDDRSIALLLTDVMMPGLNGAQLADAARRIRPALPVLFISGYSQDALTSEGRLPEGVLLLTKPYPKAELARRVRQALS